MKIGITNSYFFSSGTPPRGKRRVWFADEILNKQSASAPTTPVRGPTFSPLMKRALGGLVKSPVGSPQIRRALRPHGTNINVGPPKTYHRRYLLCYDFEENEVRLFVQHRLGRKVGPLLCLPLPLGGLWSLWLGYHSFSEQLCQPHTPCGPATHPHLHGSQRR